MLRSGSFWNSAGRKMPEYWIFASTSIERALRRAGIEGE